MLKTSAGRVPEETRPLLAGHVAAIVARQSFLVFVLEGYFFTIRGGLIWGDFGFNTFLLCTLISLIAVGALTYTLKKRSISIGDRVSDAMDVLLFLVAASALLVGALLYERFRAAEQWTAAGTVEGIALATIALSGLAAFLSARKIRRAPRPTT